MKLQTVTLLLVYVIISFPSPSSIWKSKDFSHFYLIALILFKLCKLSYIIFIISFHFETRKKLSLNYTRSYLSLITFCGKTTLLVI